MRIVAFFLLFCMLLLPDAFPAHAQGLPVGQEINFSFSPQYPRPYDKVTLTISSTMFDLNGSAIKISVNGTIISENERKATFTMGGPGSKSVVKVVATDTDGTHEMTQTLSPADVALVVEANSTVPPFYKGARLVASEGPVTLIALPDFQTASGTKIPTASLVYTWKFGDKILESQSGIGKNILRATAPVRYRDARITVTVTTQDKTMVAQGVTSVSPVDPFLRIYANDPLGGIDFAHILSGTFVLQGDEQTFRAVPYYYAALPKISWTLNGADSDQDPDLTVRTTGAAKGTAVIGTRAKDSKAINNTETRFTIQFGQARSTGIFGL